MTSTLFRRRSGPDRRRFLAAAAVAPFFALAPRSAGAAASAAEVYGDPHVPVLGNPSGDVAVAVQCHRGDSGVREVAPDLGEPRLGIGLRGEDRVNGQPSGHRGLLAERLAARAGVGPAPPLAHA